ncbi:MAG: sulfurtransferase [Hyphomicrobiales bacterium]|nr:sulfurtransferase [Hyphomicrobiales bacterium]
MSKLKPIDAKRASDLVDQGRAVLVDIREAAEQNRAKVPGAISAPLSRFSASGIDADRSKDAIFFCEGGVRTKFAGSRLSAAGFNDSYEMIGGIRAWQNSGLHVDIDRTLPDPSQRLRDVLKLAAAFLIGIFWVVAS